MHVRNVGMRLNELAASEMRLSGEKRQLQSLQKLKLEVEWMLGEVERQMSECAPDSLHPSQAEHLENLLDATGKSLRMLLDIGQHSNRAAFQSVQHRLGSDDPTSLQAFELARPRRVQNRFDGFSKH